MQLDPLTEEFPELTPYQYASDEPIGNVDMDGLEAIGSTVASSVGNAVVTQASFLQNIVITLPKVAQTGTSLVSKAGTLMNTMGKGLSWFAKGLWNEGVMPTVDWVNHNVNPVYGVFNGINSQFTHQDFFNGTPMTRAEGITDAALPFIPFGKVGGVVEKTVVKSFEKAVVKENTQLWTSTSKLSSVKNAFEHWRKHGAEFPEFSNSKQYVEGAKKFMHNSPEGTLIKTRANGDILKYHPGTNTFGVMNASGVPRTMFKPLDGMKYWLEQ